MQVEHSGSPTPGACQGQHLRFGSALVNAPTMLVASPLPGSALAGAVGVAAIMAGPVLAGERWLPGLLRFAPG